MAQTTHLAPEQLRALGRIKTLPGIEGFYLAGATAIAWHLGHRLSADLDLFSHSAKPDLSAIRRAATPKAGFRVIRTGDAVLQLRSGSVPIDFVAYPYPPLDPPASGPDGFPVAGLRDLAAMKLSAIARRGIRRDFWDLFAIAQAGLSLADAADAYRHRFGRSDADLYHVQRALTWFADADADPRWPQGLTAPLWQRIKEYFLAESPRLFEPRPAAPRKRRRPARAKKDRG